MQDSRTSQIPLPPEQPVQPRLVPQQALRNSMAPPSPNPAIATASISPEPAPASNPVNYPQPQTSPSSPPPGTQNPASYSQPTQNTAPISPTGEYLPNISKPLIEELVYEWQAPNRPFKERTKQFYTTIITIAALISLIFALIGQAPMIAVIAAIVFLFYVLSTIPPTKVLTQLTTYGIRQEEQLYYWEELGRFWLDEIHDQPAIHIEVSRFPTRLTLLVGKGDLSILVDILSEVLIMQKPAPTLYEKIGAWLQEKIPLDIDKD